MNARVLEIFSSFQGEGLFLGAKQIFVRLADCNLSCRYCDTDLEAQSDGMTVEDTLECIIELERSNGAHHSVSITGGEPLLHTDFLSKLLPQIKRGSLKIYLETNGTLPEKLASVLDYVDIIAMDIKLPSSTGMDELWEAHRRFIRISLAKGKKLFIKSVITPETEAGDIAKAADIIARLDRRVPFFLQPATPKVGYGQPVTRDKMEEWRRSIEGRLEYVRVVPQFHKLMNIR